MRYSYKIVFFTLFALSARLGYAQVQDPSTPNFDLSSPDSSVVDSNASPSTEPVEDPNSKLDPALRPYVRIILPVDSATNLITYNVVIEQEESGSDSLYARAKKWAVSHLGKELKVEVDKRNQKLTYIGSIPAYAYTNKYAKRSIGRFEFKLTFLIKEGRYKFQVTNLVHESVKPADGGKGPRNYFEYYYTSTSRVRENDVILRNADKDIHAMIDNIIATMREPKLVDEDDW